MRGDATAARRRWGERRRTISSPVHPILSCIGWHRLYGCPATRSEDLVDFDRGRKQVPRGRGTTTVSLIVHDPFLFKFLFCLSLHRIYIYKRKEFSSFTRPCFLTTILRQRMARLVRRTLIEYVSYSDKKVIGYQIYIYIHTYIVISKLFSSIRMASYIQTAIC